MWGRVKFLLHGLLPLRLRVYLLAHDLRVLGASPLPPASDIIWAGDDEELEGGFYCPSRREVCWRGVPKDERGSNGVH